MKKVSRRRAKRSLLKKQVPAAGICLLSLGCPIVVLAAPSGGVVTAGSASISSSGVTTTINQASNKAAINWQSFGIASGETVRFVQPSASSIALNRVIGSDASAIYGTLSANGQVFLINPNGILFAPGAQVNVAGLVASTLNISDSDFLNGNYRFSKDGQAGSVVNQGNITANNGYVAFLGPQVKNEGIVAAKVIGMTAGDKVSLDFNGDSLLKLTVDTVAANASASNSGSLLADGGTVLMSTGTKDALLSTVVNNSGLIQARTVSNQSGTIILEGGSANIGGTLDASAPNGGNGGFIETSGAHVTMAPGLHVTTLAPQGQTGTWLIDPLDFTVAASGGDMTGATVSSWLAANNVIIQTTAAGSSASNGTDNVSGATGTAGNININDTITWATGTTLTLSAYNNIYINRSITNTGAGSLALEYGQKAVSAGNTSAYAINAPVNLTAGQHFSTKLGSNGAVNAFTVITSLGAAGSTTGTDLQGINGNLGGKYFLGADIDASGTIAWNSGAGFAPIGSQSSAFTGSFDGGGHTISGLTINRPGQGNVGLFGFTYGATLANVGLTSLNVNGGSYVGGLVGYSFGTSGIISNSYAAGSVKGSSWVGGLLGSGNGSISSSYATGSVTGDAYVGGLVGSGSGSISSSYATGSVTGEAVVGGLAGYNNGSISSSYATGSVTGTLSHVGGLVGQNDSYGTVTNSYWDVDTSGKNVGVGSGNASGVTALYSNGGAGSTAFTQASYSGFDFANTWYMVDGLTRPFLRSEYSTNITNAHQLQLMAMDLSATYTLARNIDMGELAQASGMWRAEATKVDNNYGFAPIGSESSAFTGSFDGAGHTINGLTINRPATNDVGLFGFASGATLANVGLTNLNVSGAADVGGLVGCQNGGSISNAYTTGSVSGVNHSIGGLAGKNYGGSISNSYATASVNGGGQIGGLVGTQTNSGSITKSYATGSVTGSNFYVGGLVGGSTNGSTISNSYATGSVTGSSDVGGLAGWHSGGAITSSYWDTQTSGISDLSKGVGNLPNIPGVTSLTTAQMKEAANFAGWADLTDGSGNKIWYFYEGLAAPLLKSYLTPLTVSADAATKVYDGTTAATFGNTTYTPASGSFDASKVGGTLAGSGKDVGAHGLAGLYTTSQQGYLISYDPAVTLTITARPLTATVTAANKVYDGTTAATISGGIALGNLIGTDAVSASYTSGAFADKNVGDNKTVTLAGISLTGADAGNYTLAADSVTSSASITPASLTITAVTDTKVYNGTTSSDAAPTYSSLIGAGDTITGLVQAYDNKNAGNGKTLTVSAYTINDGNNGQNYTVTTQSATGTITPAPVTITASSNSKVYNGSTTAAALPTVTAGTLFDAYTASQSYDNKNVGSGKTLIPSITFANAADAGNYTTTLNNSSGGEITPASLTITAQANSKVYDGTTSAAATPTVSGLMDGDSVSGLMETYDNKNAGSGKTVSVTGYTINDGNSGGNYTVTLQDNASGIITPAQLIYTAATVSREQDNDTPLLSGSIGGIASGDSLAAVTSGSLTWLTTATKSSPAGRYAITGSGLSVIDGNYLADILQAPGNAMALTVRAQQGGAGYQDLLPWIVQANHANGNRPPEGIGATAGNDASAPAVRHAARYAAGEASSGNVDGGAVFGLPLRIVGSGVNVGGHRTVAPLLQISTQEERKPHAL